MKPARRTLHFNSLDDILLDAKQSTAEQHATVGTWSAGQIFEHLAKTIDVMLDGSEMKTPFYLKLAGPLLKGIMIRRPMKPGLKLPAWAAKYLMPQEISTEQGLAHLENSCRRFSEASELKIHPIFGAMSKADAVQLHCRHAELHLSHIVPTPVKVGI